MARMFLLSVVDFKAIIAYLALIGYDFLYTDSDVLTGPLYFCIIDITFCPRGRTGKGGGPMDDTKKLTQLTSCAG